MFTCWWKHRWLVKHHSLKWKWSYWKIYDVCLFILVCTIAWDTLCWFLFFVIEMLLYCLISFTILIYEGILTTKSWILSQYIVLDNTQYSYFYS
jgi:hypothetical protein